MELPKAAPGQHFEGLDMLTALMVKRPAGRPAGPLIEVVGDDSAVAAGVVGEGIETAGGENEIAEVEEEEIDWQLDQVLPDAEVLAECLLAHVFPYGFNNTRTELLARLQPEFPELLELGDAEYTAPTERRTRRLAAEDAKFSDEHYMADCALADEQITALINHNQNFWWLPGGNLCEFSDAERERMLRLPRKELLVDDAKPVLLALVGIVFAYAHDLRTNLGEHTVESSWAISCLCPTLSWLEVNYCHGIIVIFPAPFFFFSSQYATVANHVPWRLGSLLPVAFVILWLAICQCGRKPGGLCPPSGCIPALPSLGASAAGDAGPARYISPG